jgi:hypothetical protein
MCYDLSNRQVERRFLDATIDIAQDVAISQTTQVSSKMNKALFHGGPLAPKSFEHLLTIYDPSSDAWPTTFPIIHWIPKVGWKKNPGERYGIVSIEKKIAFSAILGYLEGIPGIGTVIALIHLVAHLIGMAVSYVRLKQASQELNRASNSSIFIKSQKVYTQAIHYTRHRNYLVGSALSLIPFVKPIVRLAQGILYHQKKHIYPKPQPLPKPPDTDPFLQHMDWAKIRSEKKRAKRRNALRRANYFSKIQLFQAQQIKKE